jgi:hypothetical protein
MKAYESLEYVKRGQILRSRIGEKQEEGRGKKMWKKKKIIE